MPSSTRPSCREKAGTLPARDRLADALGLLPREIGFENHTALRVAAGNTFAYVPVTSLEAIAKARVNGAHWAAAFPDNEVDGVYLYTRECVHKGCGVPRAHVRPATRGARGPGDGGRRGRLCRRAAASSTCLPDGAHKRVIEQGHEMGRPSAIVLTLIVDGGKLDTVRIGGNAVRVADGTHGDLTPLTRHGPKARRRAAVTGPAPIWPLAALAQTAGMY